MPADNNNKQDSVWPVPKFRFEADFGTVSSSFQEVSGLDIESQIIDYRAGNSKTFSVVKMPGITKFANITLKKGVFKDDTHFWDWFNQVKANTVTRNTVIIKLLDEAGNPVMVWTLNNAWPTKITSTNLTAAGNEVAIETIELAHEGLTIANG